MLIPLFILSTVSKLYACPIGTESLLHTRDTATGTGDSLRTTYGVIWSCLVTILACVWGAVHPNIPGPCDAGWTILKRRMTMSVCALLAPELMVMWALRQYFGAKRIKEEYNSQFVVEGRAVDRSDRSLIVYQWLGSIKKAVNEYFTKLPDHVAVRRKPRLSERWEPLRTREPWTMTHGFFVQMGGFILYEDEKPKKVLGFDELRRIIRDGQIAVPTVTEVELKDRSKGNTLSKFIIILQTSWFVVQCLARVENRLPLSELEVVTLAFAVMNGIVYWVWWDKPQGVSTAIPIHLQWPDTRGSESLQRTWTIERDSDNLMPYRSNSQERPASQNKLAMEPQVSKTIQLQTGTMKDTRDPETSAVEHAPFTELFETQVRELTESQPLNRAELLPAIIPTFKTLSIKLWNTIKFLLQTPLTVMAYPFVQISHIVKNKQIPDGALNVPIFYSYGFYDSDSDILVNVVLIIGALFGAMHFFGWNSVFPSHAEKLVWRVAVLINTVVPLIFSLFFHSNKLNKIMERKGWRGRTVLIINNLPMILSEVAALTYIPARIALLTLALLSLRALPQDIFIQIKWTSFIPHF